MNYRKRRAEQAPININGVVVEQVESLKFLGVHIIKKLSRSKHTKSSKEGTATPIPPQETENIWHWSLDPQKVLQLHHQEHHLVASPCGMPIGRYQTARHYRGYVTCKLGVRKQVPGVHLIINGVQT